MRTLFIHIGSGKTGTTSIQKFLAANREKLLDQNFCYPGCDDNHHQLVTIFERNNKNLPRILASQDSQKIRHYSRIAQEIIMKEMKENDKDFIISSEYFQNITNNKNVKEIRHFFGEFFNRIEIIYYVREPIGLYQSLVQQYIKAASTFPGPNIKFNNKSIVETWALHLPVTVLTFDTDQDVIESFCKIIGINTSSLCKVRKANQSLSTEQVYLLSKIQHFQYGANENIYKSHLKIISENPPSKKFSSKLIVKKNISGVIWENNLGDMEWLNEQYGTNFQLKKYSIDNLDDIQKMEGSFQNLDKIFQVNADFVARYEAQIIDNLLKIYHSISSNKHLRRES